ncbi:flagellar biosynthesis anti-sigma factor FlgM [Stieleria sp. ICT_E10.1]|uniref:flagellar biosynthesis anti-sigma factor FlgM n=1 Tax=Stieleria sedimenti TaxID=2976331 RepID=UPI00217F511B|nr:flagellar biosynthesis anti-sigma factor FlgM [Stieleria sedimenti]MCS7467322.1 flagellar biosynthesis anti-sigma factor FlgM [Stieleria sedimenti]
MQIYGPYRVSTTQSASNVQSTSQVDRGSAASKVDQASSPSSAGPVDQLDLSQAATSANRIEGNAAVAGEGIRFERVAELRRQIADGSYDSPERMDAALDRFLDLLG